MMYIQTLIPIDSKKKKTNKQTNKQKNAHKKQKTKSGLER